MVNKYCDILFKYPKSILSIIIIITFGCAFLYSKLPVETSVESLIMEDDPDLLFYNTFKEQFGEDEFLVVAFSEPEIFSPAYLRFIQKLTEQFENIEEVDDVVSLTNVEDIIGSEDDFVVEPLVKEVSDDPHSIETIKHRALTNPLIEGNLVSPDGKAALFVIRTRSHPDDETYDARLIRKVKEVLENRPDQFRHINFHLAGWLVTDVNMSGYMNKDLKSLMPLTYALIIGLLVFFLRNGWAVFLSILNVSVCLVCTMAVLYLAGGAVSPMTAILPPLIMALSVSDSVHIFTEFLRKDRSQAPLPQLMRETLRHLWVPCFLTSLTTAVGFASLSISKIPPIRHFGLAAAGGMMIEFCLSMSIIPIGIYFFRNFGSLKQPSHLKTGSVQCLVNKLAVFIPKAKVYVCGLSVLLVGLSVWGISKLNVETNLMEYFKKKSEVYQDARFIDHELGGVNTLEVSFEAKERDAFLLPANLKVIEKIAEYLRERPQIGKVTSINDFLKEMNQSFHSEDPAYYELPDSRQMAAQYLLLYGGDELDNFIDTDYQWARLSARVTEHSSSRLKVYIEQLKDFIERNLGESDLQIRVTGKTYLVNKLVKNIVDSQVQSLSLAFLIIFGMLFIVFRSFYMGLISIIPNMLPIIFNLGLMGLVGIPLNTATAIISAVAIGIAVDDTIHFLNQYQNERRRGNNIRQATITAIEIKATPIMTTSLILIGGFGILVLSSFVPTIQFGFLCSLIMLFALISDLAILPAVLLLRKAGE
ncbi:MAG: MMPL family transporter [Thermodesulfobacteriota bacterium]|nr:MMPL family transporter [Thermodesulfobacteriota bacterium]